MNVSLGLAGVTGSIAMRNRAAFAHDPALFERVKEGLGRLIAPLYANLGRERPIERVAEPTLEMPGNAPAGEPSAQELIAAVRAAESKLAANDAGGKAALRVVEAKILADAPADTKIIADLEEEIARQMAQFTAEAANEPVKAATAPAMPDPAAVLARLAQLEVIPAAAGVAAEPAIGADSTATAALQEEPAAQIVERSAAELTTVGAAGEATSADIGGALQGDAAAVITERSAVETAAAAPTEAAAETNAQAQARQETVTVVERVAGDNVIDASAKFPAGRAAEAGSRLDATAQALVEFDEARDQAEAGLGDPSSRLDAALAAAAAEGQPRRVPAGPAAAGAVVQVPMSPGQAAPVAVSAAGGPSVAQIVAGGIVDGVAGVANATKAVVTAPIRGVSAAAKALGALGKVRRDEAQQVSREMLRGSTLQQLTQHNITGMEKAVAGLAEVKGKLEADPKVGRVLAEVEEIAKDNHRGDVAAVTKQMRPGGKYEALHQDWEAAIKGNATYEAYDLTARDLVRRMSRDMPKLSNTPGDLLNRYEDSLSQGETLARGIPARKGIDGNMLDSLHDKFVSFRDILQKAFAKVRELFTGKSSDRDSDPSPH